MTIGGGVDLLTFLCPPAKAATIGMRGANVISRAAIKSGVNHAVQVTGQRGAQTLAKRELLQGARQAEKVASKFLNPLNNPGKVALSLGAESVNAGTALTSKLSGLQKAQISAINTRILSDGRIRYYDSFRVAQKPGLTKGASYVTEYNPKTGQVRSWNECYDELGRVIRIHPKTNNGQIIKSLHYPPIAAEIFP